MKLVLESTIESISSRVDGTVAVKIGTQELDSTAAGNLFQLRGKYVKILISDSNITKMEEELVDSTPLVSGKKNKSKSQRLRNVLFLLNKQNGGDEESFDAFYDSKMERLIEHYKSKLE